MFAKVLLASCLLVAVSANMFSGHSMESVPMITNYLQAVTPGTAPPTPPPGGSAQCNAAFQTQAAILGTATCSVDLNFLEPGRFDAYSVFYSIAMNCPSTNATAPPPFCPPLIAAASVAIKAACPNEVLFNPKWTQFVSVLDHYVEFICTPINALNVGVATTHCVETVPDWVNMETTPLSEQNVAIACNGCQATMMKKMSNFFGKGDPKSLMIEPTLTALCTKDPATSMYCSPKVQTAGFYNSSKPFAAEDFKSDKCDVCYKSFMTTADQFTMAGGMIVDEMVADQQAMIALALAAGNFTQAEADAANAAIVEQFIAYRPEPPPGNEASFSMLFDTMCMASDNGFCLDKIDILLATYDDVALGKTLATCDANADAVMSLMGCCGKWFIEQMLPLTPTVPAPIAVLAKECFTPIYFPKCAMTKYSFTATMTIGNMMFSFVDQPLKDAIKADIASIAGVLLEDITSLIVTASATANAIDIEFEISHFPSQFAMDAAVAAFSGNPALTGTVADSTYFVDPLLPADTTFSAGSIVTVVDTGIIDTSTTSYDSPASKAIPSAVAVLAGVAALLL